MTVNPGPVMPQLQAPRAYVGTPFIDAGLRADQEIRAQENHDVQMQKAAFDVNRTNAGIANQQAFGSGLSEIVADPSLTEPQRQQKIGGLAANTGQSDITLKMQDQQYQRQTKMEAAVMELAGAGNVSAAKHLAQQHGIQIPDQVLQDGVLTKGFAIGAKLYDYDPRQAGVFATKFKETGGDYNAALQAAGEPRRKPVPDAYTPYNYIDTQGNPQAGVFSKANGTVSPLAGVQQITKPGTPGRTPGAVGKMTAYEVKVKLFEDAYKGDYSDPTALRKAALEHANAGKPMDPVRLRQGAMKMITDQETIAGGPLYKTPEEREAAADEIVRYSMGNGVTGSTVSPPAATTPGAPTQQPSTAPLSYSFGGGVPQFNGVPGADTPPPPPGFTLE
jgi:hypothetical protein